MKIAKRVVTYKIKQERARLAFRAAANEIDNNCKEHVLDSSIYFESDKNMGELLRLFMDTGIDSSTDSFRIYTVVDEGKGFGV